jgi:putative oxidoreductase
MEARTQNRSLAVATGLYGHLICGASNLQSAVLLALRLTWGWQLVESGSGHLTHIQQTIDAFKGWGVPFATFNVYISGSMELLGGMLLVVGFATRLVSIPLVINFIVAYAAASRDTFKEFFAGQHRKGYDDFINDAAFPMLMLALIMLAFGPGKASIDYLLKRTVFGKRGDPRGFHVVSDPANVATSR